MTHMDNRKHPDTGRADRLREDPEWRARVEDIEAQLEHTICGAKDKSTGLPCMRRPPMGEHRCLQHAGSNPDGDSFKEFRDKFPHSPNVRWGMNLNVLTVCRLCKQEYCPHRVCPEQRTPPVDPSGNAIDDTCPIERSIYVDIMRMAAEYGLNDRLQDSMLESVAFAFIHRYRAERHVSRDGMVMQSITGFTRDGRPLYETKEHPLLKHISKLNDTIIKFSDALEFSPKAQTRKQGDEQAADTGRAIISSLIQAAHRDRTTSGRRSEPTGRTEEGDTQ